MKGVKDACLDCMPVNDGILAIKNTRGGMPPCRLPSFAL